jgi:hypothetical protein
MNEDIKKALIVFGGGILLFLLLKPKMPKWKKFYSGDAVPEENPKNRVPLKEPKADPKDLKGNKKAQNGMIVLSAYIMAYNSGEPQSELDKLNAETISKYGLKVFRRGVDNKVVVTDTSGKVIIENNG